MVSIPDELYELLEKCLKRSLEDSEIKVHDGNKKGTGYLGDIIFLSIKSKMSSQEDDIVVKQEIGSDNDTIKNYVACCYSNEIHFYTKIWPTMKNFQNSFPSAGQFDIAPKFYGASNEPEKRKIILENLRMKNYQIHPMRSLLSEDLHAEIFKLFAKYHAISFALKHYEPEIFLDLVEPLNDNLLGIVDIGILVATMKYTVISVKSTLEKMNRPDLLDKMQHFFTDALKMFSESLEYTGKNSVIRHGDSWSNNILIKYNGYDLIEEIKFIDFQLCYTGTPIHDLTHSFYSGASKETLNNWKELLKLYHETLSESLKGYNLEAEKIYPYEELEKEWNEYSRFGFLISLLIWGAKYLDEEDVLDLEAKNAKEHNFSENKEYVERVMDLIEYYDENGFLENFQ